MVHKYLLVTIIIICIFLFRAHKRTRSVVERGIGQLKRRFHVLHSEVRISPPFKTGKMIHVCGMLHNICKDRNIPIPLDVDQPDIEGDVAIQQPEDMQVVPPHPAGQRNEGRLYRDEFCNLHFKYVGYFAYVRFSC